MKGASSRNVLIIQMALEGSPHLRLFYDIPVQLNRELDR